MNVCQTCGACCATYRVDFHPAEQEGGKFAWAAGVPKSLVTPLTVNLIRMNGTDAASPRCAALQGEIGTSVACSIYDARPSPCREFDVSHEACARARQRHGLPPLPAD